MIIANPTKYIYPPRAVSATPRGDYQIFENLKWIAQLKYNDTRAVIKILDDRIEYWNRHEEKFRAYHTPDYITDQFISLGFPPYTVLDGGLIDQKHRLIKDTFAIWDILVLDSEYLIGTTYEYRYNLLPKSDNRWTHEVPKIGPQDFGVKISENIMIPDNYKFDDWDKAWELVDKINAPFAGICGPVLEGIVIKDTAGTLDFGFSEKNNDGWQIRSRVSTGRHRF